MLYLGDACPEGPGSYDHTSLPTAHLVVGWSGSSASLPALNAPPSNAQGLLLVRGGDSARGDLWKQVLSLSRLHDCITSLSCNNKDHGGRDTELVLATSSPLHESLMSLLRANNREGKDATNNILIDTSTGATDTRSLSTLLNAAGQDAALFTDRPDKDVTELLWDILSEEGEDAAKAGLASFLDAILEDSSTTFTLPNVLPGNSTAIGCFLRDAVQMKADQRYGTALSVTSPQQLRLERDQVLGRALENLLQLGSWKFTRSRIVNKTPFVFLSLILIEY